MRMYISKRNYEATTELLFTGKYFCRVLGPIINT